MVNPRPHEVRRFGPVRKTVWNALLLLCVGGCATRQTVVAHGEPRVVSEGESRLVLEAEPLEDGSIRLHVIRETDRTMEMDYWSQRAVRDDAVRACAVASSDASWMQLLDPRFVVAVVVGTYYVVLGMAEMIQYVVSRAVRSIASIMPNSETGQESAASLLSRDRFTRRWKETVRQPSSSVTLVPPGGAGALLLGPQPEKGYLLDAAQIERLGGRGAPIFANDGELSTTGTLGPPR